MRRFTESGCFHVVLWFHERFLRVVWNFLGLLMIKVFSFIVRYSGEHSGRRRAEDTSSISNESASCLQ